MSGLIGTRQEPGRIPMLEVQLAVLNRELTNECLRHAETKQKLLIALTLCHFNEEMEAAIEAAREEA